jgi:hypothetical protein
MMMLDGLGDLLKGEVKAWEGSWEERKLKLKLRWTAQTGIGFCVGLQRCWQRLRSVHQADGPGKSWQRPEKWIWKEGSSLRKRLSAGEINWKGAEEGLLGFGR